MNSTKKTYECKFGLGWGIAGPVMSAIRRKLKNLDLTNEAGIRFPKINELIQTQTVRVTGQESSIYLFRKFMVEQGLDDRSYDE